MNKWMELLLGLILLLAPIIVALKYVSWGQAALQLIMGGIVVGMALVGLILVMLGISDISG